MSIFLTNYMTLKRTQAGQTTTLAQSLPVQLDVVNIDLILASGGIIPKDSYDLYSIMWTSPVPLRGDYFVDQTSNVQYQVFGNPAVYADHLEVRVTRYDGSTPN